MRAREAVRVLFLAVAARCGGTVGMSTTHVARNELAQTGDPEYDLFFRNVHTMQLALNEGERLRVDALARLADLLGIAASTDLDTIAAGVRARVQVFQSCGAHVTVSFDANATPALPPADASGIFPPPQNEVESQVPVHVDVTGTLPPGGSTTVDGIRAAIRSTIALQWRLDAIRRYASQIRDAGTRLQATVHQRAPNRADVLTGEFEDAIDFLDAAVPRAAAQSQETLRVAVRIQASANLGPT